MPACCARGEAAPAVAPPRWDPAYPATADVVVRDLGIYAAIAEEAADDDASPRRSSSACARTASGCGSTGSRPS